MDFLFGTDPKAVNKSALSPFQEEMDPVLAALFSQPGFGSSFGSLPSYGGPTSAPLSPTQTAGVQGANQLLTGGSPGGDLASTTAPNALAGVLNAGPQDLTNYFNKAIAGPLDTNFANTTLPTLISQAGRSAGGIYSQDNTNNIGRATDSLEMAKGSALATASTNALQQQQQNKIAAAQAVPNLTSNPIQMALQAGGVEAQPQMEQLQNMMQLYGIDMQALLQQLGTAAGFGTAQTENTVALPGQQGVIQSMLNAFAGAAGKAA